MERKRGKKKNKTMRKRNFKTTHCMRQAGRYQQIHISRVIAGRSKGPMEREIRHATEDRDYWSHLVATCWDNPDWPADELKCMYYNYFCWNDIWRTHFEFELRSSVNPFHITIDACLMSVNHWWLSWRREQQVCLSFVFLIHTPLLDISAKFASLAPGTI